MRIALVALFLVSTPAQAGGWSCHSVFPNKMFAYEVAGDVLIEKDERAERRFNVLRNNDAVLGLNLENDSAVAVFIDKSDPRFSRAAVGRVTDDARQRSRQVYPAL
jgi:hypothetical protein